MLQSSYPQAVEESGLEIVSTPELDIVQIEKGKPFVFTALVAVKPEVTLGKYNGITITKVDTAVSDEELDEAIEKERNNNARLVAVEREIKEGDTAVIDFEGFKDGVPFEGGKGENYNLEIGSHTFIDTFEDQLVGKKAGDDVEVNVTFPEQYQMAELAGCPAVFKVKVNEVKEKELPQLDDDFAQDISEFDTFAEYKEDLKKKLEKSKEDEARLSKEDEAIKKIIDKSKMEVPDAMIETQVRSMIEETAQSLAGQGITMEQYLAFTGQTREAFMDSVRPQAENRIKTTLVLEAIAKEENIQVSDEKVDEHLGEMAASYGMDPQTLLGIAGEAEREQIKDDLRLQAAIDFVMENAKERAKAKSKKEKEADTEAAETEVEE
jgi:trigger factor